MSTANTSVNVQPVNDYGFRYSVNDFNGNEHSHQQQRKGNAVTGQYKVLLPDGRLQTVTYVADVAGYRAKVDYTPAAAGEATTAGFNVGSASVIPSASAASPSAVPYPLSVSGTIYPGSPAYPRYPLYQGVGSYGPGLIYGSPSTTSFYRSGLNGNRTPFYKRDVSNTEQQ